MFTVKVMDRNSGRPVEGAKVSVVFDGLFRGFAKDQYTDYNGEAHFDNDNGTGTIYVKGRREYEGRLEGRKVIYI